MGHLDRLIICLRVLVYGAVAYTATKLGSGLINGQTLIFTVQGTPWIGNLHDLAGRDAVVVTAFLWISQVPWLAAMVQIERIARAAGRREFLSPRVALTFRRLSQAFLVFALLECCERPAIGLYLAAIHLMPGSPDLAVFDVIRVNILLAAALFFVITRIVEAGVRLKDDADLTI
jgi:hypothetical protein